MRSSHRRILGALTAASMFIGMAGVSMADNVVNDVASGDIETFTAGGSTTVDFWLVQNNGDGQTGCNAADSSPATVAINTPAGVTANPTSLTYTACGIGAKQGVTFSSSTAGDHSITVSVSDSGVGTYNLNSGAFTLKVLASSNQAPSTPGAPFLSAGATPNNTGQFTLSWDPSTDGDAGDSVTYVLEHKDADDAAFSVVASGLTTNSYTFAAGSPEPEGTWTYRVKAYDGKAYSSYSTVSSPIVVDQSASNAPVLSTDPASAAYVDGSNLWFKDSVTVSAAGNGDPSLQDTSAGSGVDDSTLTAPATYTTAGAHTYTATVKDFATNESVSASMTVNVDPDKPTVAITCPAGVFLGAPATASWTASDPSPGSGLATAASGSISGLDTSTAGSHTVSAPTATDNVGHGSDPASCTYTVSYRFLGFFQPINDPAGSNYSTFKQGSTVPVKFALADFNGNRISDAAAQAIADACDARFSYAVYSTATPAPIDETASSNPANTGDCFRYDAAGDQFIFNWGTKGKSAVQYTIKASVFAGAPEVEVANHDVRIGLR